MTNRKIDAEIAEKVMGWTKQNPWPDQERLGWFDDTVQDDPSRAFKGWECPKFSEDISAAWEVVENILSSKGSFNIVRCDSIEWWSVRIGSRPAVTEKSAPLAICKAALKAVEVNK